VILGSPRAHFRRIDSTNERARVLASSGAPHGTLVTADEQTAGRGRQGRSWVAPAGTALLCSLVLRDPPRLLPLIAGVAVAQSVGPDARVKWPNDVLLRGRKVAGILVEGRPQERWAVLGIGLNVALRSEDLPPDVRSRAGGLGLSRTDIEPVRSRLLEELEYWLGSSPQAVLAELSRRDALLERPVRWAGGTGRGAGVDGEGRLRVRTRDGLVSLDAGEVHLEGELPGA
jgi:BirA family biotin operon repressor/biotin-[acetyl-CoA-carboxylase] ligase